MIRVGDEARRFSLRVGAIIIHAGKVLLERGDEHGETYWFLPGGRAEIGEPAAETLRREMREELDVDVAVGRLSHVIEYFFNEQRVAYHQLALYFLTTLPGHSYLQRESGPFFRHDGEADLVFDWLPLAELASHTIYPRLFQQALLDIPDQSLHIVTHEDEARS